MPVKVVDASALAAVLFEESESSSIIARLRNHTIAAPALIRYEIASVCLKKTRRHPALRPKLGAAFALFQSMELLEIDIDLQSAIELAEQTKLTLYDACYLGAARELGVELITLDEKLARIARKLPGLKRGKA